MLALVRSGEIAQPCLNLFSGSQFAAVRAAYVDRMGDGPRPSREDWSNPSSLNNLHASSVPLCRRAIDRAVAMQPPHAAFDEAARAYIAALETLGRLGEETKTYYERQTHRDDGGERGRSLHAELLAAFTAFDAADDGLRLVVRGIEREALDVQLAGLAADPTRRDAYLIERTRGCAMRSVESVTSAEVRARGRRAVLVADDGAAVWATIEECQRFVDEMRTAPEAARIDASFQRDASELVAALLIAGRAIRDGEELRNESAAVQTINTVVREYNDLVDDYNRL
jgi:hypothetical protein